MKVIGLIGGMSWESSKEYYENINQRVRQLLGGNHSSRSVMVSVDFAEIEALTFEGNWDKIGTLMVEASQKLETAGADVIVLCTNTIHLVAAKMRNSVSVPFLHIADSTGVAINQLGLKRVALLGTSFTMEMDFYSNILKDKYSLEVLVPDENARSILNSIIYEELSMGDFNEASRNKCIEIIKKLVAKGAQGVILGCTELPILIPDDRVSVPTFNTGKLHAYAAVEWALQNELNKAK